MTKFHTLATKALLVAAPGRVPHRRNRTETHRALTVDSVRAPERR